MISCSSWYCICSIVEHFVNSVVSILYCKFPIDDIKKSCFVHRESMGYSGKSSKQLAETPLERKHQSLLMVMLK